MSEEVGFHVDMETDRLMREAGLSHAEARRRALIAFGGVTQHTETLRDGRGLAWLAGMTLDTRLAVRMLVKHPGLTLVAVAGMSVAVTIGAVIFSAISTATGDLPLNEGDRVVSIQNVNTRVADEGRRTHLHDLAVWREGLTTVGELGAYRTVDRNLITLDGRSESARVAEMTASGFRIARVPPLMGRYFHDTDEQPGAPPVVVIGYSVWQLRFTGRADVIGQTIQLGDTRYTVIGVMPQGFAFPINNRVWTPLRLNPGAYERGHAPNIEVFGRLAVHAGIADAQRQIAGIGERLTATYPETHRYMRPKVVLYPRIFLDGESAWTLHLFQLVVLALLGVIGTNVAILVYARTASRLGEIAIRTALGATRKRVVAQLFAEALVLSLIAVCVGIVAAHFILRNLDTIVTGTFGEQMPFWMHPHISPAVVLYCIGLAVIAAVMIGVVPALKVTRGDVRASLQHLAAGGSGMELGKTWTVLTIAQVTVAVAILPLAIAGISSWKRINAATSAIATKQIVTGTLFYDRPEDTSAHLNLRAELVRRLQSEPGVTSVVLASHSPSNEATIRVELDPGAGAAGARDTASFVSSVVGATRIDPEYFLAFDLGILAGRTFQSGDYVPASNAVIVNRSLARKLFGGSNPVGRRIRPAMLEPANARGAATPPAPWEEIVGVVPDFPIDSGTPAPKIYRPLLPTDAEPVVVAVRARSATPFGARLRELTVATNPMLRVENIKTLEQTLDESSAGQRYFILAVELVTGSTVLLSAAGMYALMAFTITRRRREIGIRSALGAGPRRVLMSVLSRVFVQIAIGIAIGIVVAMAFDSALSGGWTGRNAAVRLPAVAALMIVVGILAALRPASRALRIQPTEALRSE
jgi:putative ABC transport system permease protein